MKMTKLVFAIVLASVGMTAHAEGMYGTFGLGSSDWSTSFTLAVGASDLAKIDLSGKKVPIAAEGGYVNFGSKKYCFGGACATGKASALYGAAVGTFDLKNKWSANVKLGLTSVRADACGFGVCASGSSTGLMFGFGGGYDLGSGLTAGADYRDFDGESVIGVNISMKF